MNKLQSHKIQQKHKFQLFKNHKVLFFWIVTFSVTHWGPRGQCQQEVGLGWSLKQSTLPAHLLDSLTHYFKKKKGASQEMSNYDAAGKQRSGCVWLLK